jgi:hypothetical protein
MLFYFDVIGINHVDDVRRSVAEFIKEGRMVTPEGVCWGIDIAFVGLASGSEIPNHLVEYIGYHNCDIDAYMEEPRFGRYLKKKIGLALIDLKRKVVHSGNNLFAREARRLFNLKLAFIERLRARFEQLFGRGRT